MNAQTAISGPAAPMSAHRAIPRPALRYAPLVANIRRRIMCPKCGRLFRAIFDDEDTLKEAIDVPCPYDCGGAVRTELPIAFWAERAE